MAQSIHQCAFGARCVAPMFAYLAVEGIRNTHNLTKCCLRLSIFACVTFAGNKILNAIFKVMLNHEQILLVRNNNVFFYTRTRGDCYSSHTVGEG